MKRRKIVQTCKQPPDFCLSSANTNIERTAHVS